METEKIVFLDIDGVLNDCMSIGVFHDTSTKKECIDFLNEILSSTKCNIVIISSWKDNYDFNVIKNLLYDRGVLPNSIIGFTEKDILKEDGIHNYISSRKGINQQFIIIDDNLSLKDDLLNCRMIKTESVIGLTAEDVKRAISLFHEPQLPTVSSKNDEYWSEKFEQTFLGKPNKSQNI